MKGLAVVTGASSGIGLAFAESLAGRGHPLLLVARREERLRQLAQRLSAAHKIAASVCVADLATEAGRAACRHAMDASPTPLETVVLNAGFGTRGAFHTLDHEREVQEVLLNCVAVTDLARHALPSLVGQGRGTLIVVSSAAAWQPIPFMATYAATKAFGLQLAEALAEELKGTGVRAIAVCPGSTRTEFATGAGTESIHKTWIPLERPERVVVATWRALESGRTRVLTGPLARLSTFAARWAPRGLVVRVAGALHKVH